MFIKTYQQVTIFFEINFFFKASVFISLIEN